MTSVQELRGFKVGDKVQVRADKGNYSGTVFIIESINDFVGYGRDQNGYARADAVPGGVWLDDLEHVANFKKGDRVYVDYPSKLWIGEGTVHRDQNKGMVSVTLDKNNERGAFKLKHVTKLDPVVSKLDKEKLVTALVELVDELLKVQDKHQKTTGNVSEPVRVKIRTYRNLLLSIDSGEFDI